MPAKQFSEISFYIVPHADDWQLFMNPNAYKDIVSANSKVIFIITTAGDAGRDEIYWKSREEGLKSSVRFCLSPLGAFTESNSTKELNGHDIKYWTLNNVTGYFFRLPDGNLDANGFSSRNYQSLSKLRKGEIRMITAIDNSTTYHNWNDFFKTLAATILTESAGISNKWVNYLNPDKYKNQEDHSDHIATGQAIQSINAISKFNQALFVGYNSRNGSQNLKPMDLFWKAGMFAAYEKAVFDSSGYSTLQEGTEIYLEWCIKSAQFSTINFETL